MPLAVGSAMVIHGLFGDLFMSGPSGSSYDDFLNLIIGFPLFIGAVLAFIGSILYLVKPELFR